MAFIAKVRSYGWYCNGCKSHKSIARVKLVRVARERHITVVCEDCNTELYDCFAITEKKLCETCEERFQCFTKSDAQIDKPLTRLANHEIKAHNIFEKVNTRESGIKSYTGRVYDKLAHGENCLYPGREDCNHSWMREGYNGNSYRRCGYMKYDKVNKEWFCGYERTKQT